MVNQDIRLSTKEKENAFKEYMAPNKFNTFFEKLKKQKIAEGEDSWKNEVLPPPGSVHDRMNFSDREKVIEALRSAGLV